MSSPVSMVDVLDWNNLCLAWEQVADNRGGPGPDRVSIRRFSHHWEENLRTLADVVQRQRYRPGPLRTAVIPKPGGGQRTLRIPNVGDRVLQRAVLNVLETHYERMFMPCSYGYRPGRSLHDAVAAILEYRARGDSWVLDADIDACFDSIDHELLRDFLGHDIGEGRVLRLIDLWIANGRIYQNPDRGIAQGMPISPLLCNVYLHRLDRRLLRGRWALVRYADDFIVCCRSESEAVQAERAVARVLEGLRLRLEPNKTQITSFDNGFTFLGVYFDGDGYAFTWQDKRFRVEGDTPWWLWSYVPDDYDEACRRPATMGTLYVTEPGARIERDYGRLAVTVDDRVLFSVPAVHVSHVVLVGRTGVTTPALLTLLDNGINLTLMSRTGKIRGHLTSASGKNLALRHRQYDRARDPDFCLQIGRSIGLGKLRNCRTIAQRLARRHPVDERIVERISSAIMGLEHTDDLASVRAQEGRGTRAYFNVMRGCMADGLSFAERSRRPPRDEVNALLSLGYSLLTENLICACEIVGLDPYDGFLHADKYGKPALALDLVEEFRSVIVDSVVLNLVNRRRLRGDDFVRPASGGIYLAPQGLRVFIGAYSARINQAILHRPSGRRLSYQKIFETQVWHMRRVIEGKADRYRPFGTR